jgi:hypothetical protein
MDNNTPSLHMRTSRYDQPLSHEESALARALVADVIAILPLASPCNIGIQPG